MKVLVDECAPRALKNFLAKHGHECRSVQEAGWSGKENGELLVLAETEFDVFVTLDTNLRYQQNLIGRRIGIVVLLARSNRLVDLSPHFPACVTAIEKINSGDIVLVGERGWVEVGRDALSHARLLHLHGTLRSLAQPPLPPPPRPPRPSRH